MNQYQKIVQSALNFKQNINSIYNEKKKQKNNVENFFDNPLINESLEVLLGNDFKKY